MKYLLLTLTLLTISFKSYSATIMQPGDIAQLQFNGLSIWSVWSFDVGDAGNFKVVSNTQTNYSLLVELFPDSLGSTPIQSFTLENESWAYRNFDQSMWQDVQGSVQLTVLSGIYDFDYMELDVLIDNVNYVQQFTDAEFQYVPIPSALYLFLSGLVGIVSIRTKYITRRCS